MKVHLASTHFALPYVTSRRTGLRIRHRPTSPAFVPIARQQILSRISQQHLRRLIAELDPQIRAQPKVSLHNQRGNLYAILGEFQAALADYDQALDLDPEDPCTYINQGVLFRLLGEFELGFSSFDYALTLCAARAQPAALLAAHAHAERGLTWQQVGDWNLAVSNYRQALDLIAAEDSTKARALQQRLHNHLKELGLLPEAC